MESDFLTCPVSLSILPGYVKVKISLIYLASFSIANNEFYLLKVSEIKRVSAVRPPIFTFHRRGVTGRLSLEVAVPLAGTDRVS